MSNSLSRRAFLALSAAALCVSATFASAAPRYDPGASDTEIKIGNILPYSGPVSAFGTIGRAASAYFDKVNAAGGINGRQVKFVSVDDAYTPSRTVEQARRLVEQERVLAIFLPIGTTHNVAIQRYMEARKVPQLFVGTGATRFGDIENHPWTIGWQPTNHTEALAYGRHIAETQPAGKIAVLMQNDDFGKDYYDGLIEGLGDRAGDVVRQTYETTDPTIDSQLVALRGSGAQTLVLLTTPKFSAMAIRRAAELGWQPTRYLSSVSQSVGSVLKPAGLEASTGIISASYMRDPTDPATQETPQYREYAEFMKQWYPAGDPTDSLNVLGYSAAQTLAQTLQQAGDELTRENVMRQALNLDMTLPMLYDGVTVKTGPGDAYPIEKLQLIQFNGTRYEPVGEVFGGR